jgi:hypothetical protein
MKLDRLTLHADALGDVIGHFYGTPIREFYLEEVERYEAEDASRITRFLMGSRKETDVI